jgi:hypothetical protein
MSSTTTYPTKAFFEATGYAPHLQPTSNPDSCGICLKDIACEAQVAVYKPLSEAERTFLDLFLHFPSKIQHTDILRLKKDQHHHTTHHHHEDEETGLRIKACGYISAPLALKSGLRAAKTALCVGNSASRVISRHQRSLMRTSRRWKRDL